MTGRKGDVAYIVVILVVVALLVGFWYVGTRGELPNAEEYAPAAGSPSVQPETPSAPGESMKEKELPPAGVGPDDEVVPSGSAPSTPLVFTGTRISGTSAPLLEFTRADYDKAVASGKLVVLYFYANWCPICKAEFPTVQSVFAELATDKVVGFRVNFNDNETTDDEEGLAREHGVPYQHTKVFVKDGSRILKAPDTWDKARYLSEINNALAS